MFLNLKWFNGGSTLIEENGAYGPIGNTVNGTNVESILDLASTKIYEAKPGMTRQWALQRRSRRAADASTSAARGEKNLTAALRAGKYLPVTW